MTTRIKLRRDTATNWNDVNPVLALGEPGYDTTNNKLKIGDGVTAWQDLGYLTDETSDGGNANTGNYTFTEDTITNANGVFFETDRGTITLGADIEAPGDSTHFHIAFEDSNTVEPSAHLYLGDDYNYFKAESGRNGVRIGASDGGNPVRVWSFNTDGSLMLPQGGGIVDSNGDSVLGGNANTGDMVFSTSVMYLPGDPAPKGFLNFDNSSTVTIGSNSEYPFKILVSGPALNKEWTFDTDGNLALPENGDILDSNGDSVLGGANLGSFKISGSTLGTTDNPDTGNWGGYNMFLDPGGESSAYIFIPGLTGQAEGAALQINNTGDPTSIVQAFGRGGVQVVTNTGVDEKVFEFRDNGALALPGGSALQTTPTGDIQIAAGNDGEAVYGGVSIRTDAPGGTNLWVFGTQGELSFPDSTTQTTAYQLVDPPQDSTGAGGDKAGMVAYDEDYHYYCKANYVAEIAYTYIGVESLPPEVNTYNWTNQQYGNNTYWIPYFTGYNDSNPVPLAGWTVVINGQTLTIDSVSSNPGGAGMTYILNFADSFTNGNDAVYTQQAGSGNIWVRSSWDETSWGT